VIIITTKYKYLEFILLDMFEKSLQAVGLSPNEGKIYEALLKLESANISTIAVKSRVHRRNVYDAMNKLVEKGLVSELILENEKHFKAVNPTRLLGLIQDKEVMVTEQLPDMQRRFQRIEVKEQAYIYKGVSGFRNYMQDILDTCQKGDELHVLNAKGGWWDPRLKPFRLRFYKEFHKKNLVAYHLFAHDMKKQMPEVVKSHPKAKFLPKEYKTDSAIDVFGDHVVTFTGLGYGQLDDDITLFVMISRPLADSYRNWFRMMWDLLPGQKL
jgi:predicted DNA-binding transcriptional regulator